MKNNVSKKFKIILVNTITISRLLGAISLPFIFHFFDEGIFALCTIILFLTDFIDGFLARTLKVSTFFGSAMDALSDKILNFSSFILLSIIHNSLLLPLVLEISILYTNYSTYRYGGNIKSTKIGKIKTAIMDVCIVFCFILLCIPKFNINNSFISYLIEHTDNYINIFSSIITIVCLIALIDYSKLNRKSRNNPESSKIKVTKKTKKTFKQILKDAFDTDYYLEHKDESIMKQLYL